MSESDAISKMQLKSVCIKLVAILDEDLRNIFAGDAKSDGSVNTSTPSTRFLFALKEAFPLLIINETLWPSFARDLLRKEARTYVPPW